jgi:hypothetical protein
MKTLEEEVEKYADRVIGFSNEKQWEWRSIQDHIVQFCKDSKWVQAEKIKAQIDMLNSFYYGEDLNDEDIMRFYTELHSELTEELQQQLKELEQ